MAGQRPPDRTWGVHKDDRRAILKERLVEAGLGSHADTILAAGQPSIRLRATREVETEPAPRLVGRTKLGGRPDVGPAFAWPYHHVGRPLGFVAQVNLAEAAPFDPDSVLPEYGLLSFFSYVDMSLAASAVVFTDIDVPFSDDGEPMRLAEFPRELEDEWRFRGVRLRPEADFTPFPWPPGDAWRYFDFLPTGIDGLSEADWKAWSALQQEKEDLDEPLDRMLGYPDLIQDTPTPGQDILLLQIDSDLAGVHSIQHGRLYFLIAEADLQERRFDRAYVDWES
ncbi:MAG: DUF1963 domain-containing protein [Acidimicrobiales bacterium]